MTKILRVMMISMSLLVSSHSFAGLLVEPVLGYNFLKRADFDNADTYKSGGGEGYGGRVGFQGAGLQIGLDYLKSNVDASDSDFDQNVEMEESGVFAGFEFPAFIRAYATYIFSATGETKVRNQNVILNDGTGGKLGLGFTLLPIIDINLDYRQVSFRHADVELYMLSISAPFNLFD